MAKRKRLEAPSADALKEFEEGFARETSGAKALGPMPPIAQIASEAAAGSSVGTSEERLKSVRDSADAERYRKALADGLIVEEIRVIDIAPGALERDRVHVNHEEMEELKASIRAHGLRLPIEVFEEPKGDDPSVRGFGLISGWRRLMAVTDLMVETKGEAFTTIKAIVRPEGAAAEAYVAMVEENEIRSDLSHYERGRIAVVAAGQGAFASVEEAVSILFHAGSKAKRSKIRAFAELHEELGDLLNHAQELSERQGLRIVGAIRSGMAEDLRHAIASGHSVGVGGDAVSEWSLMEPIVIRAEGLDKPEKAPGRPRSKPARPENNGHRRTSTVNGITIIQDTDRQGHFIRLEGPEVDEELIESVMNDIVRLLEAH